MDRKTEYALYKLDQRIKKLEKEKDEHRQIIQSMRNGVRSHEHFETRAERRCSVMGNQGFGNVIAYKEHERFVYKIYINQSAIRQDGQYKKKLSQAIKELTTSSTKEFNKKMLGRAKAILVADQYADEGEEYDIQGA